MESTRKGSKPGGEGKAEPENELSEVERLKSALSREHDLYLRALADFDNYRRRVEREAEASARSGKRQMILSLLDIIDSFDRALSHTTEAAAVSEGYGAIYRKLLSLLQSQGVTPFDSLGEGFDPTLHEAIGTVRTDEYEPDTVADEVQRGYRWGDDILRPARVRVAE
jgi:molecular chaperone GrpE